PILPTDWIPPTTGVLARLSDGRVRQFWDKDHAVAKVLAESRAGQQHPKCCSRNGTLWDLIAIYPQGAVWSEGLPRAGVFDGPIVRAVRSLENLPLWKEGETS